MVDGGGGGGGDGDRPFACKGSPRQCSQSVVVGRPQLELVSSLQSPVQSQSQRRSNERCSFPIAATRFPPISSLPSWLPVVRLVAGCAGRDWLGSFGGFCLVGLLLFSHEA
ncbi:hypothetical protein CGMCC3_g7023 [Colletotrichum fructicola]|nr:uncharacterized protein CGMCC3_g7023 [Colletotrichum fructicola]KAE9576692.1 hypothetical protein CGMCC3_g7023 [Colletotrichum fructicola]